jgi:hypothetical protein
MNPIQDFKPYDPFKYDVDIDDYMSKGGNLDVQKNGDYLVSYCLKRHHNDKKLCHRNEFFFIQDFPVCHHASVQKTMMDNWKYLAENFIAHDVNIDRFFLQLDMSFLCSTNRFDGIERKDINWLQIGCYLDWNILCQGQYYIADFQEHLKHRDYYDNTVWHHFAHKCKERQSMDKVYDMFSLLCQYYPQGINEPNIMGDEPLDCLEDYYQKRIKEYANVLEPDDKEQYASFLDYLNEIIFTFKKLRLNQTLTTDLLNHHDEKIGKSLKI